MRAMVQKEFRELRRDRRTLAMLVLMPVLLLVIFGYAANFTVDTLSVHVAGPRARAVADAIAASPDASAHLDVTRVDPAEGEAGAEGDLREDRADLVVVTPAAASRPVRVLIDGSNLFAAQSARTLLTELDRAAGRGPAQAAAPSVRILFNPDLSTSWVMVPAINGLILAFIGTIITSIGLVREREAGTLEQLAVMPLTPAAIVGGKIAPYFALAAADMSAITALGMGIFGVPFRGSLGLFALGAVLFLLVVLGLGALISTVSQTTGQAVQLGLMTVMPQVLLSGMIFPLDAMGEGVRWIGYLLPLTWFTKVAQGVMVRGASWGSLWPSLAVLAGMAVVAFGAAVARLSRELAPAGAGARARAGGSGGAR